MASDPRFSRGKVVQGGEREAAERAMGKASDAELVARLDIEANWVEREDHAMVAPLVALLREARDRIKADEAVIGKLPKDAEGNPVECDVTYWHCIGANLVST